MPDQDVVEEKKKLPEGFFFEGQLIEMADGKTKKDKHSANTTDD